MSLRAFMVVVLALVAGTASGQELLMARSAQSFPETMLSLQRAITDHGYVVSRVQRVDIGLTESGFTTDKYRIVFFGKPAEIRDFSTRFPQLVPYLPLEMTVFAEGEETLIVTTDPIILQPLVSDPKAHPVLLRWRNDLNSILEEMRALR